MEPAARPDDQLLRAARHGDREAFSELHERLARTAYGFACRLCGNAELAADVTQDAFLELLSGAQGYRFDGRLRAYLFRMIANSLYSRHRSIIAHARALARPASEPAPEARAVRSLTSEAALRALRGLTHPERVVVILRACHEMKFREIAEVLVETESAVRTRYQRAIQRLRRALAAWEDTR